MSDSCESGLLNPASSSSPPSASSSSSSAGVPNAFDGFELLANTDDGLPLAKDVKPLPLPKLPNPDPPNVVAAAPDLPNPMLEEPNPVPLAETEENADFCPSVPPNVDAVDAVKVGAGSSLLPFNLVGAIGLFARVPNPPSVPNPLEV